MRLGATILKNEEDESNIGKPNARLQKKKPVKTITEPSKNTNFRE